MENHGLEVAAGEMVIVLLTRKEIDTIIPLRVQKEEVMTKDAVKYLGVTLNKKVMLWSHLMQAADKAVAKVVAFSQIMLNVRGPKPSKCRLFITTAQSTIFYGHEKLEEKMNVKKEKGKITQV